MDKKTRICIIGGGPAGLSAGMYLEKKGYENYTILEKSNRVGGKCWSPVYKGRHYEMGAIMGVPSYYAVHDAEEFGGVTHDGPKLINHFKNAKGEDFNPMDPKVNPYIGQMQEQLRKFGELLETKYKGYDVNGHRGVAEGKYDGFAVTPEREAVSGVNENLKDLALPFKEFCKKNGVEMVQNLWIGPFTSFGYGYFDEIPAAYVLKYLDFQTCTNFLKFNLWTWKDGTQSVWKAVNDKLKHPAHLNSDVTKVERKDGKVYVTNNGLVEEFDKLIITAPLQYMNQYCDIREDEKNHFAKIDYERYDVMGIETNAEDQPECSYYMWDNFTPDRYGHLMIYYRRWNDTLDQVLTTYALRNHKGDAELPYVNVKKNVLDDLKICKTPASAIVNEWSTYYFPHIFSEDYAAGWYDQVEAMQDKYDTFYAGEIMSFGDMDETAEYSRELVERFF